MLALDLSSGFGPRTPWASLWMTSSVSVTLLKGAAQEEPLFQKWPEPHSVLSFLQKMGSLHISLSIPE